MHLEILVMIQQMSPGLVGHHVALLWRCVTFGVRRDDEAGRQRLARREPLALGVVQTASGRSTWSQEPSNMAENP